MQGSDGRIYGTTDSGGAGSGTIFAISTNGTGFTLLHTLAAQNSDQTSTEGDYPNSSLVQSSDGTLFGLANNGGSVGAGTLFSLSPNGLYFTVRHNFGVGTDGAYPQKLILGNDGELYGTTYGGGGNFYGTIFSLSTGGIGYTVLYNFTRFTDGYCPIPLMQASDGRLYGTTSLGSVGANGAIFSLNPDGSSFSFLFAFTGLDSNGANVDGYSLYAPLVQAPDGKLYGVAQSGGSNACGTLFSFSTQLAPVVEMSSPSSQPYITWPIAATNFILENSTDLIHWIPITSGITQSGVNYTFTITIGPTSNGELYRLHRLP